MDVIKWLGEENKLGYDIWNKKYKYDDETFVQWLARVSGGDTDVENMILNKEFILVEEFCRTGDFINWEEKLLIQIVM